MHRLTLAAPLLLATAASGQTLGANNYRIDEPLRRPAAARLVWSDEFTGRKLDQSKWAYDTSRNRDGWYNNERQYYAANRPENLRLQGGRLVIEARADRAAIAQRPDHGGQAYSSGKITTQGKADWTYGFYEISAKLPCGRGMWPAIWMLPTTGAWPDGGEIDIMEQVGWRPHVVHATLHTALFTHSKNTHRGAELPLATDCSAFHRYQLDWQPDAITIGVDDRAYLRVRNDQPGGRGAWPFDAPFYLILNLAVGGDWGGMKGIDDAALPQRMEVDYVRVWQEPSR